jgi:hypothetical protein
LCQLLGNLLRQCFYESCVFHNPPFDLNQQLLGIMCHNAGWSK